jgi:hypothetical protein
MLGRHLSKALVETSLLEYHKAVDYRPQQVTPFPSLASIFGLKSQSIPAVILPSFM